MSTDDGAAVDGARAEQRRLAEADAGGADWRAWGPYVAERAWGTVREDYSADGDAWSSFPFEQAVSRAYRWNEDGLSAWCDRNQYLCVGISLWNGADAVLKERYFGLSGPQGNHGEDAKDYWWYVDGLPSHAFHSTRYAYPLGAFPYEDLVATNAARGRDVGEYELIDTGVFDGDDYAMITSRWAKAGPSDICLVVDVHNRSDHDAAVHVLPTLWFRNTWSWTGEAERPQLRAAGRAIAGQHAHLGRFTAVSGGDGAAPPELLFCDNETNAEKLYDAATWGERPAPRYPKDGINDHVVRGADTVNPDLLGTKAAFHHLLEVPAGEHRSVWLRLTIEGGPAGSASATGSAVGGAARGGAGGWISTSEATEGATAGAATGEAAARSAAAGAEVRRFVAAREAEADDYWARQYAGLDAERARIARQAMAGLLASKQYYHYDVSRWLEGDPAQPAPPAGHATVRNDGWRHVIAGDVILMPDAWEYPWFAAWDLAFHCMALAPVDPEFAKKQLLLLLDERYLHPNGDVPAYEWNFSDTNPPVQAWAALQIFAIDGSRDIDFLRRVMHKLMMNFTWWVNRKDAEGNNVFEGGFLGLDNIGAFDRSKSLHGGEVYEQSDATAWMAMYCLDLLRMALTLARVDHTYDDLAVTFLLRFCTIAAAAQDLGLWDGQDGFFYDQLRSADGTSTPVKIRSVVGLIPLAAVTTIGPDLADALPAVMAQLDVLFARRPELRRYVHRKAPDAPMLLAMVGPDSIRRLLQAAFDPAEFLSDFGLRSMSAVHRDHPAVVAVGDSSVTVRYEPAESRSGLFGGNSNWRGPIWFPINVLLISALRRYHDGTDVTVDYPTGSGTALDLGAVADDLAERLLALFLPGKDGIRPCQAHLPWQDDILFHEYFDGDTGFGLGADHQTGWTALITLLLAHLPG